MITFEGIQVPVPSNPEAFLSARYVNWKVPCKSNKTPCESLKVRADLCISHYGADVPEANSKDCLKVPPPPKWAPPDYKCLNKEFCPGTEQKHRFKGEHDPAQLCTRTRSEVIQNLYQVAKNMDALLTQANIVYSVTDGSLLGAVRHQGIIPWDDDVDIWIPEDKRCILRELATDGVFNKMNLGYFWRADNADGSKEPLDRVYLLSGQPLSKTWSPENITNVFGTANVPITYPWLDIDFIKMDPPNNKFTSLNELTARNNFPYKGLFPIKRYKFGPFEVNGPQDGKMILDVLFPKKNYMTKGVCGHSHEFQMRGKTGWEDLTAVSCMLFPPFSLSLVLTCIVNSTSLNQLCQ